MAEAFDDLNVFDSHVETSLSFQKYRLKWTLKDFSALPCNEEFTSPHSHPALLNKWKLIFRKGPEDLYLYFQSKFEREIKLTYEVSFFDLNGKRWFYDKVCGSCFAEEERKDILKPTENIFNELKNLSNDTLIIVCSLEIDAGVTTKVVEFQQEKTSQDKYIGLNKLSEDFKALFDTLKDPDVVLSVNGSIIQCHKNILCARSPVFQKMFLHQMDEQKQNVVKVDDVEFPTLKKLIAFLYSGVVDAEEDVESTYALYYAADKYEVFDLRKLCARNFESKLTVDNAIQMLIWADRHEDKELKATVFSFIHEHFAVIVDSQIWESFSTSEVKLAAQIVNYSAGKFKTNK